MDEFPLLVICFPVSLPKIILLQYTSLLSAAAVIIKVYGWITSKEKVWNPDQDKRWEFGRCRVQTIQVRTKVALYLSFTRGLGSTKVALYLSFIGHKILKKLFLFTAPSSKWEQSEHALAKERDVRQQKIKPDLTNQSQYHGHILMAGASEGSPHWFLLWIYLLSTQLTCSIGPQLSISVPKSNEQPAPTLTKVPSEKFSKIYPNWVGILVVVG